MKFEVVSGHIDIKNDEGICDAFVSHPAGAGKFPAVIFLMDAFGVRPNLYKMAEKIAGQGYFVLLPHLFYRHSRAPIVEKSFPLNTEDLPEVLSQILPLTRAYDSSSAFRDFEMFFQYISKQNICTNRIGITGYCMGGSLAVRAAAKYFDKIQAVASFHAGRLVAESQESPHLLLPQIKAELYFAHADNDSSMTAEQILRFEQALKNSKVEYKSETYLGAVHGFTMSDLPMYNEAALERHWKNLFDLFHRRLQLS